MLYICIRFNINRAKYSNFNPIILNMGQVIKLGAQGKKELAVAFKVTMAYVGQVLSGQKKGGKAPAIWEAAKKRNDSKLYNVDEIAKHETVRILDNKGNVKAERTN